MTPTCPACTSTRVRLSHRSTRNRLTAGTCQACGLRFILERLSAAQQSALYQNPETYRHFVEAERSVDALSGRQRGWARQLSRAIQPAAFTEAHRRRPRLLDIGCGAGDFLVVARDEGFDGSGLEISAAAGALAKEFHQLDVQVGDYRSNQQFGYYEAVTMIGVLEHVLDPVDLVQHAGRLLTPGGVLLIYTPVWGVYDRMTSWVARVSNSRWSQFIDRRINAAHLQIFPQETLRVLLEAQGLSVQESRRVCEYNLPVGNYLRSMSIGAGTLGRIATAAVGGLIDRNLFFRNNQRVLAAKRAG